VSNVKLTERVTVDREITGIIRDLVLFVRYLEECGLCDDLELDNDSLVRAAREYWDREHGE
jgi:hypothetical protein